MVEQGPCLHGVVGRSQPRGADRRARRGHVVQQPAGVARDQVGPQRPRGVHVAERGHQVRYVGVGEPLVGPGLGEIDRHAVDGEVHLAEGDHLEPGRRDDDVGIEMPAGFELDPRFGERHDPIGHHRGCSCVDGVEQVAVRHETQALVPGRVARREVGVDVVVGPECLAHAADEQLFRLVGRRPHALVHHLLQRGVLPAGHVVGDRIGQHLAQPVRDLVDIGARRHVGRRPLEHGHVSRRGAPSPARASSPSRPNR